MLVDNSKKIVIKLGSTTVVDHKGKFKKKWVTSLNYFSKVDKKLITNQYCFLDHHKALFYWDKIETNNNHCIHIDAHHDLYSDELTDWNMPNKIRGNFIGVGNYLFKALKEQKIGSITWVIPEWLDKKYAYQDLIKYIGQGYMRFISIIYYSEFFL